MTNIRKNKTEYLYGCFAKSDSGKYNSLVGYGSFLGCFEKQQEAIDFMLGIEKENKIKLDYKIKKFNINIF